MYRVFGSVRSNCDAKETHADREVYSVEDLLTHQKLNLCPKCFQEQVKLRSKGRKVHQEHPEPPVAGVVGK